MLPWRRAFVSSIAIAAVGISVWIWAHDGHQIDPLGALWGVIAGIVALVVAIAPWASRKAGDAVTIEAAEENLEKLAESVEVQWREEAETRGLFRPFKLAVRWSAGASNLSGRIANVASADGDDPGRLSVCHPVAAADPGGGLPEIADVFERLPDRRLVILGEPGAGKSVLLLMLTLELLDRRQPGQPVPVLFPVASWDPRELHVHMWMSAWLENTYVWLRGPSPIPRTTLAQWLVRTKRVIPLLDGLDEMAEPSRSAAIRALNRTSVASPHAGADMLVITCRTSEYARIVSGATDASHASLSARGQVTGPMADAAVVELRPLRTGDVEGYLLEATPEYQADKWRSVRDALNTNPAGPLAQALSTPLMTAMAREAYSETTASPNDLLDSGMDHRSVIEEHLLDQLIPTVYSDIPSPLGVSRWEATEANGWFEFLARYLKGRGTRDLAWWEFGCLIPRPLYWAFFGIFAGLIGGVSFAILSGLWAALFVGGATAIVAPLAAPIVGVSPPSVVKIRFRAGAPRFAVGFALGLLVAFILELLLGLPVIEAVVAGAYVGCAGGLACGLEFLLEQPVDTTKAADPHSVLVSDRTAVLIRVLGVGVAGGLALGLAIGLDSGVGLERGMRVGIVVALAFGLGITVVVALRTTLVIGIAVGLFIGGLGGVVTGAATRSNSAPDIILALTCGIWLWLVIAIGLTFTSAWGSYLLGRAWASVRGDLPWHLSAFLDDGHRRGVLRQTGAVYQFRHAALQDRLARGEQSSVMDDGSKRQWPIWQRIIRLTSVARRDHDQLDLPRPRQPS